MLNKIKKLNWFGYVITSLIVLLGLLSNNAIETFTQGFTLFIIIGQPFAIGLLILGKSK